MEDDGYAGTQGPLDCKKYSQYCDDDGKPLSSEELLKMQKRKDPKKTEPPKPWEWSHNFNIGFHIGGASGGSMPEYYGETENSANVPYFPGGNQNPNVCVGRAGALGCFISLMTSIIPAQYGPANTDDNFFVSFNVHYNEATGVNVSDMYWSNHYGGAAVFPQLTIGDKVVPVMQGYMPTDGQYRPVSGSGGWYNGNERIEIEMPILTLVNTPNGTGGVWNNLPIAVPSLSEVKNLFP